METRNDHVKRLLMFFKQTISMHHAAHLRDFYLIAGALLNKYFPLIQIEEITETGRQLVERLEELNLVYARVEAENLRQSSGISEFHLAMDIFQTFPSIPSNNITSICPHPKYRILFNTSTRLLDCVWDAE